MRSRMEQRDLRADLDLAEMLAGHILSCELPEDAGRMSGINNIRTKIYPMDGIHP